jgi:hypothetical protein
VYQGYTWALSDAAVPATIFATEATQAAQWRLIYLKGFYVRDYPLHTNPWVPELTRANQISRPLCIINATTFGYLAYHGNPPPPSTTQTLYFPFLHANTPTLSIPLLHPPLSLHPRGSHHRLRRPLRPHLPAPHQRRPLHPRRQTRGPR